MIVQLLSILYFIISGKSYDATVDANTGSDDDCKTDTAKTCATIGAVLDNLKTLGDKSLKLTYGTADATNMIDAVSFEKLEDLSIVTSYTISYPFKQKPENVASLLTFKDITNVELTTLKFVVTSQGALSLSNAASVTITGCSVDGSTRTISSGFATAAFLIRDADTVTFSLYTAEDETGTTVNNTVKGSTAVGCAGIDADRITTFHAEYLNLLSLSGSGGVGIRFGSAMKTIELSSCYMQSITSRAGTELGNGGAILLPAVSVADASCKFTSCTFELNEAINGEGGSIYSHRSIELESCLFDRPHTSATATIVVVDGSSTVTSTSEGTTSAVDVIITATTFDGESRLKEQSDYLSSSRSNRDYEKEGLLTLIQCNSLTVQGLGEGDDLKKSAFKNTDAQVGGGGITCQSVVTITVKDTEFIHTRGPDGSGILCTLYPSSSLPLPTISVSATSFNGSVRADSDGGQYGSLIRADSCLALGVMDCSFHQHRGKNIGGAIYVESCTNMVEIQSTTFFQTNATSGGAIYLNTDVKRIHLSHVSASNCSADTSGAAIHINATSATDPTVLSIDNLEVSSCSSPYGAGLSITEFVSDVSEHSCHLHLSDSSFSDNTATQIGGGIAIQKILKGTPTHFSSLDLSSSSSSSHSNQDEPPYVIQNVTFTSNACEATDYSQGEYTYSTEPCGGAIAARSGAQLSSSSSALSNDDSTVISISDCTFTKNSNGALASENNMNMLVETSTFDGNLAFSGSVSASFDVGCKNSKLFIHPSDPAHSPVFLCDNTCKNNLADDEAAAKCNIPNPQNVKVNVTMMKVRVYPRMNTVQFSGANLFPYQPLLSVSLSKDMPPSLTNDIITKLHNTSQLTRSFSTAGKKTNDDETKYVFTPLSPSPITDDHPEPGLLLDHTLNLGDLKETYPDYIYLYVSTDGGVTWNTNTDPVSTMSIRFDPIKVKEDEDPIGAGTIAAIILGILGVIGFVIMIIYEIIRRRRLALKEEPRQTQAASSTHQPLLSEDTPQYM